MIVAVLDTNVLASAVIGLDRPESTRGELLRRARSGAFTLVVSEPILAELVRTLTNPYSAARIPIDSVTTFLGRLRTESRIQPITVYVSGVATHPEDDAILATALSAQASHLVTGDRRLLALGTFSSITIVTPREFLDVVTAVTASNPQDTHGQ